MGAGAAGVTGSEVWAFVAAAVLVVVAGGLFSIQTAIDQISPVRVGELIGDEAPGAERLGSIVTNGERYDAGLSFLRTLAQLLAVVLVAVQCARHLSATWEAILVATGGTALVTYVVVGVLARAVGHGRAESVALKTAGIASILVAVLGPLPAVANRLARAVIPSASLDGGRATSEAELRHLVDQASERRVIEFGEQQMIQSVFDFGDTLVREVMVPRTDMVWIERTKTVKQALSLALRSGFSRVPVIGDNEDDVVGVAYLKDLARRAQDPDVDRERVEECMRPPYLVPESKPVDELLREMQTSQVHVAIVIDEYGGTAGLVTMEDIIEEIVGEIVDEYDREKPRIETLDDGSVRVNVRVPIDDIEDMFDVTFDVDGVETVGGLLASELGRVPIPGTTVTIQSLTLTAEGGSGRRHRVSTVLISKDADHVGGGD